MKFSFFFFLNPIMFHVLLFAISWFFFVSDLDSSMNVHAFKSHSDHLYLSCKLKPTTLIQFLIHFRFCRLEGLGRKFRDFIVVHIDRASTQEKHNMVYSFFWISKLLAAARRFEANSAAWAAAIRASGRARADREGAICEIDEGATGSAKSPISNPEVAISFLKMMAWRSSSARTEASWAGELLSKYLERKGCVCVLGGGGEAD